MREPELTTSLRIRLRGDDKELIVRAVRERAVKTGRPVDVSSFVRELTLREARRILGEGEKG